MFVYSGGINRAAWGVRRFGDIRYSEGYHLVGSFPTRIYGTKIVIYDSTGLKKFEIGDDIRDNKIISVNFTENSHGCVSFNFTLSQYIAALYNYRVDIFLYGQNTPWFSGYINKKPRSGTTETTFKYEGYGYYDQLETCIIDKEYFAVQPAQKGKDNSGSGSMTTAGTPTTSLALTQYKVVIDGAGSVGAATFKWSDDGGSTWNATGVTTSASAISLNNGVTVTFSNGDEGTSFEAGDFWTFGAQDFDMEISNIVEDIVKTFIEPKTNIVYNPSKLEDTDYIATYVKFDKVSAKDAFQDLADIAQNFVFGVDEYRELFFSQKDTTINNDLIKFIGKHVEKFEPEEDIDDVRNKLYIRCGAITDGSNYIGYVEDSASKLLYGLREDVVTSPTVLDSDDALRWGQYKLTQVKDAKQQAKLTNIDIDRVHVKAEGKARIFDRTGVAYEIEIVKVSYKITSKGMLCDIELGAEDIPIEQQFLKMIRDIKNQEILQAANLSQLS